MRASCASQPRLFAAQHPLPFLQVPSLAKRIACVENRRDQILNQFAIFLTVGNPRHDADDVGAPVKLNDPGIAHAES